MAQAPQNHTTLRLNELSVRHPTAFGLAPDAQARDRIASDLGLLDLRKLSFSGTITAEGAHDWRLEATLGASVVQSCVVTLAPVTTRIDTVVTRRFLADMPDPDPAEEIEMPEDVSAEPLTDPIDLERVMIEALALSLPDYPRADGATLGTAVYAAPGVAPLREEETRPFASLADLKARLKGYEK